MRLSATLSSNSCTPARLQCWRAMCSARSCRPMARHIHTPRAAAKMISAMCSSSNTTVSHLHYPDAISLRIMPAYIHVPELHGIPALGGRLLIGRLGILRQTLLDQFDQRLAEALRVSPGLDQRLVIPDHREQRGRRIRQGVAGLGDGIGIGNIGFDVEHGGAIEQIDAGNVQATGLDAIEPHHRLPDRVGAMGGPAGEYAYAAVAAQPGRTHAQVIGSAGGGMEHEQQPQVADTLESFHRFGAVIGRVQLDGAPGCRCQTGLAGNGKLLGEAGMYHADGVETEGHQGFRSNGGIDCGLSSSTKWLPSATSMICRFSACRALSSMAPLCRMRSRSGTSIAPR